MLEILETGRECNVVLVGETLLRLERTPAREISKCHTQYKIPYEFHVLFIEKNSEVQFQNILHERMIVQG